MRVLLTGWFSFRHGEATAGDLLAMEVARDWIEEAEVAYDVARSPVLGGGVDLEEADPTDYTDVVFVCGPAHGWQLERLRERFPDARLTYLDVSMTRVGNGHADLVFERDSDRLVRPDLSIAASSEAAPFVPVIRGHAQPEYGDRDRNSEAEEIIEGLLERHALATVTIDTRVDPRSPGTRSPAQVEGLIARAHAVITSRLHGLVLAMKHEVPALAIDPVRGGGKVSAQARALKWPEIYTVEEADDDTLDRALTRCLHPASRGLASRRRHTAVGAVDNLRHEFMKALTSGRAEHRS